jgi:hypothetical protein
VVSKMYPAGIQHTKLDSVCSVMASSDGRVAAASTNSHSCTKAGAPPDKWSHT